MLSKSVRNHRYVLHALARIPVFFAFLILGLFIPPSYIHAQTIFTLDQVSIVLNGAPIFVDNFDDGVPPENAPNFLTGESARYDANGTFKESDGKLNMKVEDGAEGTSASGNPLRSHRILLPTPRNPANALNLGPTDTFAVSGVFDLKDSAGRFIFADSPPTERFRIHLGDRTMPQGPGDTTNDVIRLGPGRLERADAEFPKIRRCRDPLTGLPFRDPRTDEPVGAIAGQVVVQMSSADFVLNTDVRIDCFGIDLRDDPDQIRLTLAKNDAASNVITGSFTYLKNGSEIRTVVFPFTDTIFNGGTIPLTEPPPFGGTSFPAEQFTHAQWDAARDPGPPPLIFATLTTGSPVSLSQTVDTSSAAFNLEFDFLFTTATGELTVLLGGIVLGTIPAPGVVGTEFTTRTILVNNPSLLGRTDINLEFRLDGPTGSTVRLDNVVFPGIINGDFQTGSLTGWNTVASGTGSVGVDVVDLEAELVNGKVRLVNTSTTFSPTPCRGSAAGRFTIRARFENISQDDLFDLIFNVKTLTGGNVLCNADGAGGVGAELTVPLAGGFNDGKLAPGEAIDVVFRIGLANRNRFTFLVDLSGVAVPID